MGFDFLVEQKNEQGEYDALQNFDNSFKYDEKIYAAYAIISNEKNRLGWQFGLRGELSEIGTELIKTAQINKREYFNLFPSAFFSYKVNKNNTLQFNYSRRLSRPHFRHLLPFSNFSDSRNFFTGNPNLNPEYTHAFEAGFLKNWKTGSLLSSVYYRYRTGVIDRIRIDSTINNELKTFMLPVNLSVEKNTGFEFNLEQDLVKWWNLSANFNFYHAETNGSYQEQDLSRQTFTWNGRVTSKIKIKKVFDFQANFFYRAPQQTTQGRNKSFTFINIGLSRDVMKGKGTITLSVQDLLNSRKFRYEVLTNNFSSDGEWQGRMRQIKLGFNYRLNQSKKRQDRERENGDMNNDF